MEFEDILKLMKSENHVLKDSGFNEVFKKLEQPLIGFYMHRKLNKSEAEEVVISSLVKICAKAHTLKDSKKSFAIFQKKELKKFESWCWQVARNTLLDHFKKYKKYKKDVSEEVLEKSEIVERVSSQKERKNEMEREECVRIGVQEFGRAMPEREFAMSLKMQNFSNQQISLRIGRTLAATKEFMSQNYKRLKPFLENCVGGND